MWAGAKLVNITYKGQFWWRRGEFFYEMDSLLMPSVEIEQEENER